MPDKTNLKKYYEKAGKEGWAIGQFNFSDLKILEAIVLAAQELNSPVILATSEGESKSIGLRQAVALVKVFREETCLPLFLNLDHGKTFGYIKRAVDAGYDAVHFDGSALPLAANIQETQEIIKYAKKFNVWVEGEMDVIGGKANPGKFLTDPQQASSFVKTTKIDSLAVAVGNLHGGKDSSGKPNKLDLARLREVRKAVGNFPLVLHGGSGVSDEDVRAAMGLGIVKININTELRMAYINTLRAVLQKQEIVPYKYMPEVVEAVKKVVKNKIKLFGSENKA